MTWWRQALRRLRQAATAAWRAVRRVAHATADAAMTVQAALVRAARRHRDRVAEDRAYSRTVSTAASELITTVVPRPVLAAALAVGLAGLLAPGDHHKPAHSPADRYDPAPDYSGYPPGPSSPTGPLWDRFGT